MPFSCGKFEFETTWDQPCPARIVNARIARTIAAARTAHQRIAIAGMLAVNVSSNYKTLSRSLDNLGRKQLPFAFAKTLNETMKAVEKYTVARTYPRAFDEGHWGVPT
jgi:hypothetical protein